jgi:hypothetical protein
MFSIVTRSTTFANTDTESPDVKPSETPPVTPQKPVIPAAPPTPFTPERTQPDPLSVPAPGVCPYAPFPAMKPNQD